MTEDEAAQSIHRLAAFSGIGATELLAELLRVRLTVHETMASLLVLTERKRLKTS